MDKPVQEEEASSVDHPGWQWRWAERDGKQDECYDVEDAHSIGKADETFLTVMKVEELLGLAPAQFDQRP
jgi:hypothetical protein